MLLVEGPVASTSSSTSADGSDDDSSGVLRRGDERKLEHQRLATQVPAASVPESPPFGKRLFGFVMSVLLLVGLGYFANLLAGSFREAWRSSSWPSVMGTVKSSTVQRTGVGKNARVVAFVTYHYEVNAVNHTGHRICVEGYTKKFFESAQAVSERYVVEQQVKVFYDPKNPVSAVLLTGTTPGLWWPVIMLALLGSSIGYGTYASFRSLIIVDDKAGMIHFQRCFRPPGFWTIKTLPWFSCPLKSVTSVSQMTFKGTTTLTIHTNSGKGSITSHAMRLRRTAAAFPENED